MNMQKIMIKTGRAFILSIIIITQITVQTSCVKEPLYDTDHPEHGKITLTTTWDDRGEGIAIPAGHTAHIGAHTAALTDERNTLDHLFPEGQHSIHIYNVADNITLSSPQSQSSHPTTASADYAAGELGWFFTGTHSIAVEKDKHHEITVPMRQQVRQLTLELEITGNARERITGVGATLSGVAGAISIDNGNPTGNAVTVALDFVRRDAACHVSTIRLLGISGNAQNLSLALQSAGGNPAAYTVVSDLSAQLAAFNADKKTPLTLSSTLDVTATESGFAATVDSWIENGGNIIAH